MICSPEYMRYIAAEVRNTTQKDTEIFNSRGNLLASTLETPSEKLDELSAFPDMGRHFILSHHGRDNRYALTTRILCPGRDDCFLRLYGESTQELITLCNPVAKLVEALILQEVKGPVHFASKKNKEAFFEELVLGTYSEETVHFIAASQQVNLSANFFVAVLRVSPYNNFGEYDIDKQNVAMPMILAELSQYHDSYTNTAVLPFNNEVVVVSGDLKPEKLREILQEIVDKVKAQLWIEVNCGITSGAKDYSKIHTAYRSAEALCAIAARDERTNIVTQNEYFVPLVLEFIPVAMKREYVEMVFKDSTDRDIEGWYEIIQVLNKNNGSIGRSAEELFMHKNTLQYRLNRIKEKTGYDPRHTDDALSLMLAFSMRKSLQPDPNHDGHEQDPL